VLRITVTNDPESKRFVVEGKLAGECVGELEKCWSALGSDYSPESILVDLTSVSFIDDSGKRLLSTMHEKGIRIVATGLMPRFVIAEIEATPLVECHPEKSDPISS
jgi:anti-anti-sigma regulatory factor